MYDGSTMLIVLSCRRPRLVLGWVTQRRLGAVNLGPFVSVDVSL